MSKFRGDFFSNYEAGTEQMENEEDKEKLDYYSSQTATNDEEFDIEEATISSLNIFSELMELGEDVEDAIKTLVDKRMEVIKKLIQEGKLNNISDNFKKIINNYLKEKNNEGR